MRIHFVAVSGTGMGSLAGLLKAAGHEISGSDTSFDPPMGPALKAWGVRCLEGFDPEHLKPAPDLVVIGNVCRRDNPQARAAIDGGLRYTDMAHALGELILEGTSPLVVAGTHGKTTTTTLCSWLLYEAGKGTGFLVGGLPKNFPESFRVPDRSRRLPLASSDSSSSSSSSSSSTQPTEHTITRKVPFVVEGDEYDTAFFEKTPKCWHYRPEVAIVTSIEHDHVDIYPTEESYFEAFRGFIKRVPDHGLIVAAANEPHVVSIAQASSKAPITWYAIDGDNTHRVTPEWLAYPVTEDSSGQSFDLFVGGTSAGRFVLPIPGRHNMRNAVAAIAACAQGYGVSFDALRSAMARFAGVRRRQDLLGTPNGVFVYDDFAHHPTAVNETLLALSRRHPGSRVIAVFEPRSATACRAMHQDAYASSFDAAHTVIIAPRGRTKVDGEALDLDKLVSDLAQRGKTASAPTTLDAVIDTIVSSAKPGDVVALLSNGAFGGVPQKVVQRLEK